MDAVTSKEAFKTISAIADRALKIAEQTQARVPFKKMDVVMSIELAHSTAPLRLNDLLNADDFNVAHDVFGIMRHLDHETGELTDCFSPRYAA